MQRNRSSSSRKLRPNKFPSPPSILSLAAIVSSVDENIDRIRTRSLDLSFNELLDMHSTGELIIQPEYQRLFRWSEGKQSRFIESLILEMPIPPIFVIEMEDGRLELIDGLQRISSYLHFRGQNPTRVHPDGTPSKLRLLECDVATALNGLDYDSLPSALQIRLKRNFVRVEIIRKESDLRLRYYMFKRLNTGGENLSDQEVRNCTIRLLSNTFNQFIMDQSQAEDFAACLSIISEEQKAQRYDQELVLRFFAFKNYRQHYIHEVGDFMTEYMERVSDPAGAETFEYDRERQTFLSTFKILGKTLGENAFARTNTHGNFISSFLSYHYEAFTLGLQPYLEVLSPDDETQMATVARVLVSIKNDEKFRAMTTGGGKNYPRNLSERIALVQTALRDAFTD